MAISNSVLRAKLWTSLGDDPRYRNFLMAAGLADDEAAKKGKYSKLLELHSERIGGYKYYNDLYSGRHWFTVSDENINPTKINLCWTTVNKHATFLMGKGFLIESNFPDIEKFLQKNWVLNSGGEAQDNIFGLNLAINGGIYGDVWVSVLNDVHKITGENYIKYTVMDSMKAFPVLDRGECISYLDYGLETYVHKENYGFAEYQDRNAGYFYKPGFRAEIIEEEVADIQQYDFLDLPIVHFSNFPTNFYYGISDLTHIADLNTLYDRLLTDIQDIVDYHASPVTIITGAKGDQLVRGANKVWSIPKDASIKNLELNGDLGAAREHLAKIRESIADISNIPEMTLGKLSNISNTSGAALAIQFMPLYETMELKRIFYGRNLLDINILTIKYAILKGELSPNKIIRDAIKRWEENYKNHSEEERERNYPFSKKIDLNKNYDDIGVFYRNELPKELFQTYITWFPPLPRDEKILADIALALRNGGLISKRHARSMIGLSEKESILMERELEKELDKISDEKMIITNNSKAKFKSGLENDPDIKGQNISDKNVENNS